MFHPNLNGTYTLTYNNSRVRPWNCCIACGDYYSYYDGRCVYDPDRLLQNHHFSQDKHLPWLTGSDGCCFFCGYKAGDFIFLKNERKCEKNIRHQLQRNIGENGRHSSLSFSQAKCTVCEIIMKSIGGLKDIALNKVERELQNICDVVFFFQHFCHNLLQSQMDQIKDFLEKKISVLNICERFDFCTTTTTLKHPVFDNTTNVPLRHSAADTELEKQVLNLAFPIGKAIMANKKSFKFHLMDWKVSKVFPDVCAALNRHHCEKLCLLNGGHKIEFYNDDTSFKTLLPFSMNNKNSLELLICD